MNSARRFSFLACSLFLFASFASAQLLNVRSISSVYTWEKFDTVDVSKKLARGDQFLMIDLAQDDFSFHTTLQGAVTLQRNLDETPDFRAYALFVRWRNIGDAVDFSLGRFPYFAGVGTGTMDGGLMNVRLVEDALRFTIYGGRSLPPDFALKSPGPLDKNFVGGGRILLTSIENTRAGVSYMNRQRERQPYFAIRADSLFNPIEILVEPDAAKEQYLSGDISYRVRDVGIYGRYDYDLNFEQTQRGQLGVRYDITPRLRATADFIHRAPRLAYNSFFAVFSSSTINEYEAGADYVFSSYWRGFARGAYVKYTDDETFRYTLGVVTNYGGVSYRGNSGYAGDLNGVTVYGSYPLWERRFIPSASFSYYAYTLNEADSDESALAAALGATVRPLPQASLDLQVQWLQNRVTDNDVRFFAKLNLWFSDQLNIFN